MQQNDSLADGQLGGGATDWVRAEVFRLKTRTSDPIFWMRSSTDTSGSAASTV